MKRLQYQSRAQVLAPSYKERSTPDKWLANETLPVRRASTLFVLAAATALAFVPVQTAAPVAPSVASWHPEIQRPVFTPKRLQYLFPALALDTKPLPNVVVPVLPDKWHPLIETPPRDLRRWQYLYPELAFYPAPVANRPVLADSWHPPIEQPRFDKKRLQYLPEDVFSHVAPVTPQVFPTGSYPVPQVSNLFRAGSAAVLSPDGDRLFVRLFGNVAALQAGQINLQQVTIPRSNYPGVSGQVSYDADFIYLCIAPNLWRRLPHGDF